MKTSKICSVCKKKFKKDLVSLVFFKHLTFTMIFKKPDNARVFETQIPTLQLDIKF